ncbi:MAG: hypothetical protein K0U93_06250, partial [Gammaproteobacteria bacterium]|nr:hypothetical protein [Gammaproteobacteria bacterium]
GTLWAFVRIVTTSQPTAVDATLAMVGLFLVYFTFVHVVLAPLPRYSVPLHPLAYFMAFSALNKLWARLRHKPA